MNASDSEINPSLPDIKDQIRKSFYILTFRILTSSASTKPATKYILDEKLWLIEASSKIYIKLNDF